MCAWRKRLKKKKNKGEIRYTFKKKKKTMMINKQIN